MATSDTVIADIARGVAALGAPDEFLYFLKIALDKLVMLGVVEHISMVEAAQNQYKH
jgi:hypothetical protein